MWNNTYVYELIKWLILKITFYESYFTIFMWSHYITFIDYKHAFSRFKQKNDDVNETIRLFIFIVL